MAKRRKTRAELEKEIAELKSVNTELWAAIEGKREGVKKMNEECRRLAEQERPPKDVLNDLERRIGKLEKIKEKRR